jgi:hypothetical protein
MVAQQGNKVAGKDQIDTYTLMFNKYAVLIKYILVII